MQFRPYSLFKVKHWKLSFCFIDVGDVVGQSGQVIATVLGPISEEFPLYVFSFFWGISANKNEQQHHSSSTHEP